jgi:eukaryotic-like serine/threonine-protein kinase
MTATADRHLLLGLLALQNGLIHQSQLVAAFQAWTLEKSRPLADHLVGLGHLSPAQRSVVEAMAALHLEAHGGEVEKSLAAVPAGKSTLESLAAVHDPEIERTLSRVGSARPPADDGDADRTASYAVGTAAADGQRFRVLRPHARGGLGAVFVALDAELNRELALKQILDQHADDPTSRARFLLEAEITGGLEHPGIVPIYGLGIYDGGRPYYAMRFIKGDSLKEAADRFHADEPLRKDPGRRVLELRKLLRRFTDVCDAIGYAHSRGVLHRDIKPGNIIVGRYGETLVVDWGLAKATGRAGPGAEPGERMLVPSSASGSAETLPGSALGTPAYTSPEQAEGDLEHLGPRSDVYSLGATLYYVLSGRPPVEGDVAEVLRAVQKGEFLPPRRHDASIDPALEAVCLKAMSCKTADRYPSPKALADDIERWTADEPVTAWREPLSRRARRWARRNQTPVAATAVALVAGVIGLGAVAGVQARANGALQKANTITTAALNDTRRAQAQTKDALAQSELLRQQAEAVSNFLVDAFRSPDPSSPTGRDVKVADMLNQAGAKLEQGFAGSRAIQGALQDALGRTFMGLGIYDRAVDLLTKARAVREAALGLDHPDTLATSNSLAIAFTYAGRLPDAIALHESTLRRREAKLGADHLDAVESRANLATSYQAAGRLRESIALNEATLKVREVKLGPDNIATLRNRNNLAVAYRGIGRLPKAIALYEPNLKLYEAKMGPAHPLTLTTRYNLAGAYRAVGRIPEAIALSQAALKLSDATFGPDHPQTLNNRILLAMAYLDAGRLAEAIAMHEATDKLLQAKVGRDHRATLINRENLACAYLVAGRGVDALAEFEATLKLCEAKLGPDHPVTLETRGNLADAVASLVRFSEAEGLLREMLARLQREGKSNELLMTTALTGLGRTLLETGRCSEAEPLLREAVTIVENASPDDWNRYNALSLLGWSLVQQRRYAEPEPVVITAYDGMKAREVGTPAWQRSHLRQAAERVVRLYEAWQKPDQAAVWKAKVGMRDLPAAVFAQP